MPEDMGGEIMEISGLGQEPEAIPPFMMPTLPGYSDPFPSLASFFPPSPWGTILAIGIPILGVVAIKVLVEYKKLYGGGSGLGIIKKCRVADRTPRKVLSQQVWCLWDSKGKRILGRHPNKKKALSQEKLIQLKKKGIL